MANLTLSIDDDLLKRARMRALEQDTSVNALVRDYLESVVGEPAQMRQFLDWAASVKAGSGPAGRTWTRDELYER
jgi:plasmid stability protein